MLCLSFHSFLHFRQNNNMSSSKTKGQHKDRTLKEKLDILCRLYSGMKAVDICRTYHLSASTLLTWKKQRTKLKKMVEVGKFLDLKQNCDSFLPQVQRPLHIWFTEMQAKLHPHQYTNNYSFRKLCGKYNLNCIDFFGIILILNVIKLFIALTLSTLQLMHNIYSIAL